ncbi:unnamed protein product [Angiostrongylus costaricensis]|uniref:Galectin n=1 Tax=Angiostrongylus costaricensis TaxID=334426 RepID=A0A158PEC2_ANGCS|nr:unnamed protein product [Angiostrongylus costaricensis]
MLFQNIPFRRELHSGCAIGTSITCTAQAFEARPKTFSIQLISANDIAILVTLPIAKNGQITASARVDGRFTSEMEKPIFLPLQTKFTLRLHVAQYVIEIYFNNDHIMDFVHRVSPSEIKAVAIEGPLIVDEVVFTPPQGACLDPLPTYEEATGSSINPVPELRCMNIEKSPQQFVPTAFQQFQSHPLSSTPSILSTSSSSNLQPGASQLLPTPYPTSFPPNIAQIPTYQTSVYPNNSQAFIYGSVLPGTSYPQQPMSRPCASTPQYPISYAGPQPYVHPQFTSAVPGTQIHPQYNLYQHRPPFQYPPMIGPVEHVGPYTHGYVPHHYGTYPIIYGSTCHSIKLNCSKTEELLISELIDSPSNTATHFSIVVRIRVARIVEITVQRRFNTIVHLVV